MISHAELLALCESGGTVQHIAAILRAGLAEREARRIARLERLRIVGAMPRAAEKSDTDVTVYEPVAQQDDDKIARPLGRKHTARKAVLGAPGLSLQDQAVIAVLIDRADAETGQCYPSRRRIALDASIGGEYPERAVSRAIQRAEASGLLHRLRRGGGRGRATVYELDWHAFAELLAQREGRSDAPRMRAALRRLKGDNRPSGNGDNSDTGVTPTLKEIQSSESPARIQRARAAPRPDPRQPQFMFVFDNPLVEAAAGRIIDTLSDMPQALPWLQRNSFVLEVAADAELRKAGDGVADVYRVLALHGIGPPDAVARTG